MRHSGREYGLLNADWDDYDDDDVYETVISSSWCSSRSGIVLSFAIPIEVMSLGELNEFGEDFTDAVKDSYGDLISDFFLAKTDEPMVTATNRGELIMMWSFQGDDDRETRAALASSGIREICYE